MVTLSSTSCYLSLATVGDFAGPTIAASGTSSLLHEIISTWYSKSVFGGMTTLRELETLEPPCARLAGHLAFVISPGLIYVKTTSRQYTTYRLPILTNFGFFLPSVSALVSSTTYASCSPAMLAVQWTRAESPLSHLSSLVRDFSTGVISMACRAERIAPGPELTTSVSLVQPYTSFNGFSSFLNGISGVLILSLAFYSVSSASFSAIIAAGAFSAFLTKKSTSLSLVSYSLLGPSGLSSGS